MKRSSGDSVGRSSLRSASAKRGSELGQASRFFSSPPRTLREHGTCFLENSPTGQKKVGLPGDLRFQWPFREQTKEGVSDTAVSIQPLVHSPEGVKEFAMFRKSLRRHIRDR